VSLFGGDHEHNRQTLKKPGIWNADDDMESTRRKLRTSGSKRKMNSSEPWAGDMEDLGNGNDLLAIIRWQSEAIEEIRQVATGEKQVVNDDTEGMAWIAKRIAALKPTNDKAHRPPTTLEQAIEVAKRKAVDELNSLDWHEGNLQKWNIVERAIRDVIAVQPNDRGERRG